MKAGRASSGVAPVGGRHDEARWRKVSTVRFGTGLREVQVPPLHRLEQHILHRPPRRRMGGASPLLKAMVEADGKVIVKDGNLAL
jgi:hypothetical protein